MKNIVESLFFISLITCCVEKKELSNNVDFNRTSPYSRHYYFDLTLLDQIKPGWTTEDELYQIVGKSISIRKRYVDPILPKYHLGRYKPVDKMVYYEGANSIITPISGGTKYSTKDFLAVTFFLYKGNVQFYSILSYEYIKPGSNQGTRFRDETTRDLQENSGYWPDSQCDSKFYDINRRGLSPGINKGIDYVYEGHCKWEEVEKIGSDYLELLEDPHYGERFECCK